MEKIIVWFTNDLRLHDHEALWRATQKNAMVIPVYCFDERHFAPIKLGFRKTGIFRAKFLLEAVANLQKNLQKIGSNLVILKGKPEVQIAALAQQIGVKAVFGSKEVCAEETAVEQELEIKLRTVGIELNLFWQATLLHLEDLPFPLQKLPDVFTDFRKNCEKIVKIRPTFKNPNKLLDFQAFSQLYPALNLPTTLPTLQELGFATTLPMQDSRAVLDFEGGETTGLQRLQHYFWDTDQLKVYKETRNGLIGADYSSKFSAWLALGCLSPRKIYEEIADYEQKRVQNDSTYWLFFELLWRDYFRLVAKKYGNKLFALSGLKGSRQALQNRTDQAVFEQWIQGKTGLPFIDANMKELQATGFLSNRGRQNVASYLVKDLHIHWQWGASYFESQLIDYDVCSNWGNWNYIAGVGNDPRENRYFNIATQAKKYDEKGEYVRLWVG